MSSIFAFELNFLPELVDPWDVGEAGGGAHFRLWTQFSACRIVALTIFRRGLYSDLPIGGAVARGADPVVVGASQIFQFSCWCRTTSSYRSRGLRWSRVVKMYVPWVALSIFDEVDGDGLFWIGGGGTAERGGRRWCRCSMNESVIA